MLYPPHGQASPSYAHAQQPHSAHPTHTSHSQAGAPRGYENPSPTVHHKQRHSQAPTFGSSARDNYAPGPVGSSAGPVSTGKYDSRRYDERDEYSPACGYKFTL